MRALISCYHLFAFDWAPLNMLSHRAAWECALVIAAGMRVAFDQLLAIFPPSALCRHIAQGVMHLPSL